MNTKTNNKFHNLPLKGETFEKLTLDIKKPSPKGEGWVGLFFLRRIPFYQFHAAFGTNTGFVETQVGVHGTGILAFLLMTFSGLITVAASRNGT